MTTKDVTTKYDDIEEADLKRLNEYYYYIYDSQAYEDVWGDENHRRRIIEELYDDEQKQTRSPYSVESHRDYLKRQREEERKRCAEHAEKQAVHLLTSLGYTVEKREG
jgi:hypothetical protein